MALFSVANHYTPQPLDPPLSILSTFTFSDFKKLRSEKHIRAKPFPGTDFGIGTKSSVL
jgi:hypothetical protein